MYNSFKTCLKHTKYTKQVLYHYFYHHNIPYKQLSNIVWWTFSFRDIFFLLCLTMNLCPTSFSGVWVLDDLLSCNSMFWLKIVANTKIIGQIIGWKMCIIVKNKNNQFSIQCKVFFTSFYNGTYVIINSYLLALDCMYI